MPRRPGRRSPGRTTGSFIFASARKRAIFCVVSRERRPSVVRQGAVCLVPILISDLLLPRHRESARGPADHHQGNPLFIVLTERPPGSKPSPLYSHTFGNVDRMARLRIAKAAAVVVVVALVGQLVRQSSALVVPGTSGTTRRPLSSVGGQQQQRHEPSASSAPTYRSNVASDRRKLSISHEVVGGLASLVGPVGSPLFLFPTDTDDSPSTSSTSSTTTKEKKKEEEEKATSMAKEEFWKAQAALASSMSEKADRIDKAETRDKFAKRRLALVNETLLFSTIIFSCIWLVGSNPFTAISYAFGATLGTAYSYGLGKYVETIGGSADDVEDLQGAGVGQARFAFLILLFVFVGKFRSVGLQEIPSIVGFFTYQIASLSQGLREYDD